MRLRLAERRAGAILPFHPTGRPTDGFRGSVAARMVRTAAYVIAAQMVAACLAAAPAAAQQQGATAEAGGAPPTAAVARFDRFIASSGPICQNQASGRCVDLGLAFADRDGDGRLSLDELDVVRRDLKAWLAWKGPKLTAAERTGASLGLWLVETAGLPALFESFDANSDGHVTRRELLADVRLDHRPLGDVLLDPEAVDRSAVASRVGKLAPFLQGFFGMGASAAQTAR